MTKFSVSRFLNSALLSAVAREVLQGPPRPAQERRKQRRVQEPGHRELGHLPHPGERGAAGPAPDVPRPRTHRSLLQLPVPHRDGPPREGGGRREAGRGGEAKKFTKKQLAKR